MSAFSTGAVTLAPHRVAAMVLRYLYLLRSSWTRLLELIYWPAVQLLVWGFLQFYIAQNSGFFARASGVFIAAVLMWDVLFRGQLGFSISFLEEMWSRNLTNLMISPLRPIEFVCALMIMSLIRLAIGMVPVTFLAIAFFGFNVYGLGLALAAFFVNLILTSWAVGIVVSGTWYFGYGDSFDESALKILPAGSFYTEPPGMDHFAMTKATGVVIQIAGTGPSGTTYADPKNDPAKR